MKKIASVFLVLVLACAPVTAFALDRVEGLVRKVDIDAFIVTIVPTGESARQMSFKLTPDAFDELALDVDDQISVEYDKSECSDAVGCISTATKVERRS